MATLKKVNVQRLEDNDPIYKTLKKLIKNHHEHLKKAKIALAWRSGWSSKNGRVTLGQCRKVSDLDKEFHDCDFIILLNKDRWQILKENQRLALLDHELCHAQVVYDKNGLPKQDDLNRTVYGIRKHDIEEFREIVERHGFYKSDLYEFAESVIAKKDTLFAGTDDEEDDDEGDEAEEDAA